METVMIETTEQPKVLTVVEQLQQYDQNAERLYPKMLKDIGITIDRETGEIVRDKAGSLLLGFGIPDLISRLSIQQERESRRSSSQDNIARARIWRHVTEASKPLPSKNSEGSISDITKLNQLNPWLPEGEQLPGKGMPARRCESCGMYHDVVELHFDKQGNQTDARSVWFCWWCFIQPATRAHYKIEPPKTRTIRAVVVDEHTSDGRVYKAHYEEREIDTNPPCLLCNIPWDCISVGGHVPVKGEDDAWVCYRCVREHPKVIVGSSVVIPELRNGRALLDLRPKSTPEKDLKTFVSFRQACVTTVNPPC